MTDEERKERKRESNRKWYEKNREKMKERARKYRANNPEKIRELRRKYYVNNPEKIRERRREYYVNNSEKVREQSREYYSKNSERLNAQTKIRCKNKKENVYAILHGFPCHCCGNPDPSVIQWHHINPEDKDFALSSSIGSRNVETFWNEVLKCIPLCANCHVKIHRDEICLIRQIK